MDDDLFSNAPVSDSVTAVVLLLPTCGITHCPKMELMNGHLVSIASSFQVLMSVFSSFE